MLRSDGVLKTVAGVAVALATSLGVSSGSAQAETSFKEDVFPIIQIRCLSCHQPGGDGYEASGLDMRTYEGLMKGTKHGPMVIPNDAGSSNLLTLIDGRAEIHMPIDRKLLSKCERATFRSWVQQGAKDN